MWIDTLEQQLDIADTQNLYIYTVGDFNTNFSIVNGFQNTKWSNLIAYYNLTQLISHPIYLPIMPNPCWGPIHMRVKLQQY